MAYTRTAGVLYCNPVPDGSLEASIDFPTWKEGECPPTISPHLSADQRCHMLDLLRDHAHILSDMPGKTTLISHKIDTGSTAPIAVPPRTTSSARAWGRCQMLIVRVVGGNPCTGGESRLSLGQTLMETSMG